MSIHFFLETTFPVRSPEEKEKRDIMRTITIVQELGDRVVFIVATNPEMIENNTFGSATVNLKSLDDCLNESADKEDFLTSISYIIGRDLASGHTGFHRIYLAVDRVYSALEHIRQDGD